MNNDDRASAALALRSLRTVSGSVSAAAAAAPRSAWALRLPRRWLEVTVVGASCLSPSLLRLAFHRVTSGAVGSRPGGDLVWAPTSLAADALLPTDGGAPPLLVELPQLCAGAQGLAALRLSLEDRAGVFASASVLVVVGAEGSAPSACLGAAQQVLMVPRGGASSSATVWLVHGQNPSRGVGGGTELRCELRLRLTEARAAPLPLGGALVARRRAVLAEGLAEAMLRTVEAEPSEAAPLDRVVVRFAGPAGVAPPGEKGLRVLVFAHSTRGASAGEVGGATEQPTLLGAARLGGDGVWRSERGCALHCLPAVTAASPHAPPCDEPAVPLPQSVLRDPEARLPSTQVPAPPSNCSSC